MKPFICWKCRYHYIVPLCAVPCEKHLTIGKPFYQLYHIFIAFRTLWLISSYIHELSHKNLYGVCKVSFISWDEISGCLLMLPYVVMVQLNRVSGGLLSLCCGHKSLKILIPQAAAYNWHRCSASTQLFTNLLCSYSSAEGNSDSNYSWCDPGNEKWVDVVPRNRRLQSLGYWVWSLLVGTSLCLHCVSASVR